MNKEGIRRSKEGNEEEGGKVGERVEGDNKKNGEDRKERDRRRRE